MNSFLYVILRQNVSDFRNNQEMNEGSRNLNMVVKLHDYYLELLVIVVWFYTKNEFKKQTFLKDQDSHLFYEANQSK